MAQTFACWWPSIIDLKTDSDHAAAIVHCHFLLEAHLISRAITDQLKPDSIFKNCLSELPSTASFLYGQLMDLPFHFEVFLPIRVPMKLVPSFDEKLRTVQLVKPFTDKEPRHPFLFGNRLNATCINILLEHELQQAIAKLGSVYSFVYNSVVYDLSYRAHHCNLVPFMHEILAVERGRGHINGRRCLRFDFILAVRFEGPVLPLPPYYNAPIKSPWLAYGQIGINRTGNPAELSVILPKWQTKSVPVAVRCRNVLLVLHRILYAQHCHNYAVPGALKLGFATVVQAIVGWGYERTSSLQLIVMIMQKLVEQNLFRLDYPTNVWNAMLHAGQQRMRVEEIIELLQYLMELNDVRYRCMSCGRPCFKDRAPPRR